MAPLSSDSISDRFTTHPSGFERRIYARRAAAEIPWLSGVRLKYGPPVSLIDLSRGGAQIDAAAHRLRPGARVLVEIAGRDMEVVVQSRVVRCHVSALEPQAVYRAALAFERALDLPDVPSIARTIDLDTNPVYEHARPIQSQWNQIMLRYTDGRLLKGFSRDRLLTNGHVEVWALPDAPRQARITVPVRHLKAVIFLGGSEGEAAHAPEQAGSGARPAAVTFLDDEVIVGTVLDYKPDGVGFFLSPLDAEKQDVRLFIFSGAIRHVRLLPA